MVACQSRQIFIVKNLEDPFECQPTSCFINNVSNLIRSISGQPGMSLTRLLKTLRIAGTMFLCSLCSKSCA